MSRRFHYSAISLCFFALWVTEVASGQVIRRSVNLQQARGSNGAADRSVISAFGPQRDVIVGTPTPVPPYRSFLGSEAGHVSVDWVAPERFVLGQEADFELVLRNRGPLAVEDVIIQPEIPQGFKLVSSTPKADLVDERLSWRLAKLVPQEETRIRMRLHPKQVGSGRGHARVTYSTASATALRVVEPMLKIRAEAPERAILGSQVVIHVTVSNPGTGKATNAILEASLPEGLTRKAKSPTYGLGTLNPGETRSIRIVATMSELGNHFCQFAATADHGLHDETSKNILGLGAQLDLALNGPTFRYVTRPATYTLTVKNTGTAAAESVSIRVAVPKPFAFLEADKRGTFDAASKSVNWLFDGLEVGQETDVSFKLRALAPGEFPILANADADRGLSAQAQHLTRVEGIAAILLEVVDVDDPVEVGSETTYEVLLTNQGTEFATNVRIQALAPEGVEIIRGKGPTGGAIQDRTITFAPLPKLAPRADAIYRIKVRGLTSGDFRFEVQAIADTLVSPVTELESTKIYQD